MGFPDGSAAELDRHSSHSGLWFVTVHPFDEPPLNSSTWVVTGWCWRDTVLRDINDPLARGVPRRSSAGGRSTSYELSEV